KESNQRKGFSCFESKATSAVLAQAGATLGILPKVAPGARPCAPPSGCPSVSRVTGGARQQQQQQQQRWSNGIKATALKQKRWSNSSKATAVGQRLQGNSG
ncbi:hypothetical protein, partial [Lysobacter sp. ISL-52]|uniref:hypothetical protein n=1 Tax=Lysobacter sp. ISL-52 TaxID=2819154 RepID=UPI001BEB15ED